MTKKYFLFDCETGGVNPKSSLLTVFGYMLDDKLNPIDKIDLVIKPDNGLYILTASSMAINKINIIEHDKVAIKKSEAIKVFNDFCCKHAITSQSEKNRIIPAGHNLAFDIRYVKRNLLKANNVEGDDWKKFFSYRQLDTAATAQALILAQKLPEDLECSLASLAAHFNLDYTGAHNAEFDVELTLKILKLLLKLM
jgi:DNA polymerase III alpha subunit (gram-positive type)